MPVLVSAWDLWPRKVEAVAFALPCADPPTIDMVALGMVAAARLAAIEDTPEAARQCASKRSRELAILDDADPRAVMASRILLHECAVCGRCAAA